jgi:hypothetical protein
MHRTAELSTDGRYRYALTRTWNPGGRAILFVGLNPSTADARTDDPTIRRCIGFAQRWQFGTLIVANLYALRSSDPSKLATARDPVGPENDRWLRRLSRHAAVTVVAWGAHPAVRERETTVLDLFDAPMCLGMTLAGHPRHPLYVRGDTRLQRLSFLSYAPVNNLFRTDT